MTTYERIVRQLQEKRLLTLQTSLQRAVLEESKELSRVSFRTRDLSPKKSIEEAKDYYAEDIEDCFYNETPLTPEQILGHRRKPIAWAIATIMKREGCTI